MYNDGFIKIVLESECSKTILLKPSLKLMTLTLLIHPLFQNPSLIISHFVFSFHEQQQQHLSVSLLINSFSLSVRDERYPRGGTPKIDLDLRHLGDERGRDVVVGGPRWNLL